LSKPYDRVIVLDFETAWGREVKLGFSCQTNEEYVRDPRFKAWGLCWKDYNDPLPATWIRGKDIVSWARDFDWSRTAIIAQNAQFDASILAWHYDVHPAFIFDTLSMGRALRGVEVGNSLKKLAEAFELPPKGEGLHSSENYLDELPFHVEQELADYCRHDVFLCEEIFKRLADGYPTSELRLIDMTLKMYTEPKLVLDREMLALAIDEERKSREELLERLGVDDATLSSNPKFADLLASLGCDIPYKTSKTTGLWRWLKTTRSSKPYSIVNETTYQRCVKHGCESSLQLSEHERSVSLISHTGVRYPYPSPTTVPSRVDGRQQREARSTCRT
jgi:hypothetical protein